MRPPPTDRAISKGQIKVHVSIPLSVDDFRKYTKAAEAKAMYIEDWILSLMTKAVTP